MPTIPDRFKDAVDAALTHGEFQPVEGPQLVSVVRSQDSSAAYHSTLFEDFRASAVGFYNFYESDELTNPEQDPDVHVSKLARYVELSWRLAPQSAVTFQAVAGGTRQVDDRLHPRRGVTDVRTAKESTANGYINPGVVSGLLVPPTQNFVTASFDEDSFLMDAAAARLSATTVVRENYLRKTRDVPVRTRVNFIDPSVTGLVDKNRLAVSSEHVHLAVAVAGGKLLPGLEVLSEFTQDTGQVNPPPTFSAPMDTPTVTYIGYVVERYDLSDDGSMHLAKTIDIDDPTQRSIIDKSVLFEGRYAYRIRTIVQWARLKSIEFDGKSSLVKDDLFDPSAGQPLKNVSFYAGDWSDWAHVQILDNVRPGPPDELIIRPVSRRGLIDIVWKMPYDPQLDLASVKLLRTTSRSGRLGQWQELGQFPAVNGRYIDRDVLPFDQSDTAYVYAMYSTSLHGEVSPLSEVVEARLSARGRSHEEPLRQLAESGADPFAGPSSVLPNSRESVLVGQRSVRLGCRTASSSVKLADRSYVVEIQSLSTGERVTVDLAVDSTDASPSSSR